MQYDCGCEFDEIDFDSLLIAKKYQEGICPATWRLLSSGLTKGVFQLESQLGQTWSKKLQPSNLSHLAALIALLRPGVLNSKDENNISMAEHYVLRKNKLELVQYIHPALEPILAETFGIIIYQEQIIKIAQVLCGMSEEEADILRKGIGKKDTAVVAKCKSVFIEGAKKTGIIPEDVAETLWENIEKSNRYLFNKSHSYEYATNLYWSAYAKAHAQLAFLESWLFFAHEKQHPKDEIRELVNDSKLLDINVLVPDIRISKKHFSIRQDNIYFGICDIKGVGQSQYEKMKSLEFKFSNNWLDTLCNFFMLISEPTARALISVGAFDWLGMPRIKMLYEFDQFTKLNEKEVAWGFLNGDTTSLLNFIQSVAPRKKTAKDKEGSRQFGGTHTQKRSDLLLGAVDSLKNPPYALQDTPEWLASIEYEYLGVSITCAKVDSCDISAANCTCKEFISGRAGQLVLAVEINRIKEFTTKTNKPMGFLSVSDGTCALDNVVVFSEAFIQYRNLLQEQNTVLLQGQRDRKKGGFIVNRVVQI